MEQEVRRSFQQSVRPPKTIFALMAVTNILINLDHGILPACTNELKQTYSIDQTQLGLIGSMVYIGIVVMGFAAGSLYQRFSSKILAVSALLCLELSLFGFIFSKSFATALICRFITGACQVFLLVYYPIWIDRFGGKNKTIWLTLLQICVPLGIFAGYGLTSLLRAFGHQFTISFYIQIVLVAFFILAFGALSILKLDIRQKVQKQQTLQQSMLTDQPVRQSIPKSFRKVYIGMVMKLLKSKMYFVGTITMSILLFMSTGIQFWLTDYFINVLSFDTQLVNISYGIVSITGPTLGCGFGGWAINRIGGYDHPKTVYLMLLFSLLGIASAVIFPFVHNFYVLVTAVWILLFFGGAMLPGLTGIMMSSVPVHLRAFGNSSGEIIKNIFGFLPAPFMYGWFNQTLGGNAGIKLIMFWGLWAPILLGLGSLHRYHQLKNLKNPEITSSSQLIDETLAQEQFQSPQKIVNQRIRTFPSLDSIDNIEATSDKLPSADSEEPKLDAKEEPQLANIGEPETDSHSIETLQ